MNAPVVAIDNVSSIECTRDVIELDEPRFRDDGTEVVGRKAGYDLDGTEMVTVKHPGAVTYEVTLKNGSVVQIDGDAYETILREVHARRKGA